MLSSSPTHQRMQSLDSTGSSTAATTPATPTTGGFAITSPSGPVAGSHVQQTQQPSCVFSGKSGAPSPDTAAATSPRPSATAAPVTMFGDTLLHHRASKQVGSALLTACSPLFVNVVHTAACYFHCERFNCEPMKVQTTSCKRGLRLRNMWHSVRPCCVSGG
jgi:hypothetical protein